MTISLTSAVNIPESSSSIWPERLKLKEMRNTVTDTDIDVHSNRQKNMICWLSVLKLISADLLILFLFSR